MITKPVSIKKVGNCLTERKLIEFDAECSKFSEFVSVSQFLYPKPTHISQLSVETTSSNELKPAEVLFGVSSLTGDLTFLGEILDSGG